MSLLRETNFIINYISLIDKITQMLNSTFTTNMTNSSDILASAKMIYNIYYYLYELFEKKSIFL